MLFPQKFNIKILSKFHGWVKNFIAAKICENEFLLQSFSSKNSEEKKIESYVMKIQRNMAPPDIFLYIYTKAS